MYVIYDHREKVAQNTWTFWFRAEQKPDYIAGQFIELYLPHKNPDNRGQRRWFTLSSSPSEDLLAITTNHAQTRYSTFKRRLFNLARGDAVSFSQPMGDFVLPKNPSIPLVFIAAGVGITPVRSMLVWLSDQGERREIHVIYALRDIASAAFSDQLKSYHARIDIVLSHPHTDWHGLAGSIDFNLIKKLILDTSGKLIYISGPEQFVEKIETDLRENGVSADKLILDYYHGYGVS